MAAKAARTELGLLQRFTCCVCLPFQAYDIRCNLIGVGVPRLACFYEITLCGSQLLVGFAGVPPFLLIATHSALFLTIYTG